MQQILPLLTSLNQAFPQLVNVTKPFQDILKMRTLTNQETAALSRSISEHLKITTAKENEVIKNSLLELTTILSELKDTEGFPADLLSQISEINRYHMQPADQLSVIGTILKSISSQLCSLRLSQEKIRRRDPELERKTDPNIIHADLHTASKRIVVQMASLLKMMIVNGIRNAEIEGMYRECLTESKKSNIQFFDAVSIMEKVSAIVRQTQSLRQKIETDFVLNIQHQLASMHTTISELMASTTVFERSSDLEKEKLLKALNGFKSMADEISDIDELKSLVNSNIEQLKTVVGSTISKIALESRQLNRELTSAKEKIITQSKELSSIRTTQANMVQEISQARIQAITDPLTNIPNRLAFDRDVKHFQKKAGTNEDTHYSLIMIDIDHFKSINDGHGHDIGDKVLMKFAQSIKEYIDCIPLNVNGDQKTKLSDFTEVFRMGGEEFSIRCAGLNLKTTVRIAEYLRGKIADTPIIWDNGRKILNITASFGVAFRQRMDAVNVEDLYVLADRALYESKNSGRNRVSFFNQIDSSILTT